MNQREIRRIARQRAAMMIESALNYGWEPDDLMEQLGPETMEKVREEVFFIMLDVRDRGKRQS